MKFSEDVTRQLTSSYEQFKIKDAHSIAVNILYAKQWSFDFRGKPGRQLARLLADVPTTGPFQPLRKPNGELTKDIPEKLGIFVKFFQNFYSSVSGREEVEKEFLERTACLVISLEHRGILENPITLSEVVEAIDALKSNKAPGPDALTPYFYKKFKEVLSPYL